MNRKTKEILGCAVNGLSFPAFFYLASTLVVPDALSPTKYPGWILLTFGVVLVVLSIATLVRNRKTGLIDWGIYGIVRHPMYLGAMILFLSWSFFLPHWIMVLISSANIGIVYWVILQGERRNIDKFGNAYQRYMETVPRINLLAGLLRRAQSRGVA
jgi:protein-S-isoprenylcysteine O-methyltransferase Ste14